MDLVKYTELIEAVSDEKFDKRQRLRVILKILNLKFNEIELAFKANLTQNIVSSFGDDIHLLHTLFNKTITPELVKNNCYRFLKAFKTVGHNTFVAKTCGLKMEEHIVDAFLEEALKTQDRNDISIITSGIFSHTLKDMSLNFFNKYSDLSWLYSEVMRYCSIVVLEKLLSDKDNSNLFYMPFYTNKNIDINFIRKYENYINFDEMSCNPCISIEILEEFKNKNWNITKLCSNSCLNHTLVSYLVENGYDLDWISVVKNKNMTMYDMFMIRKYEKANMREADVFTEITSDKIFSEFEKLRL